MLLNVNGGVICIIVKKTPQITVFYGLNVNSINVGCLDFFSCISVNHRNCFYDKNYLSKRTILYEVVLCK